MRILLLTQLFQPEPNHLKGLRFARELAKIGHEVQVLTGFPNYPQGRIYSGYCQTLWFRENMEGIPIVRVPLYPSHNLSGLMRFFTYLSLMMTMIIPGLFLLKKPDIVYVYLGPATLALPALILRLLLRVPYVLDIQDLWPESVTSSGMLKIPGAERIIDLWCRLSYRYASRIIVLSPGYKKKIETRGVSSSKIEVVYNWCDEAAIRNAECREDTRKKYNLNSYFVVIYVGNLGPIQALDAVVDAGTMLKNREPRLHFVFLGDGADSGRLRRRVAAAELSNVLFIPRQSPEMAGCLLAAADAGLVHLRNDSLGRIGIPQKLQAYMAAGKPVLLAMKGDAADLIRRAKAGIICEPEDPKSIAQAAEKLLRLTPEERERMGRNGREYYQNSCSFGVGVQRLALILSDCAG